MPFVNAAPMTNFLGINDLSGRTPVYTPEAIPSHLPKIYIYAERGPSTPQLVVGDSRTSTYGVESFNLRGKFANHATVLSNVIDANGNFAMIQRVIPDDAAPPANVRLSLDVLPTMVDIYRRDASGNVVLSETGDPVKTGQTTAGYKCKLVTEYITTDPVDGSNFGKGSTTIGSQVDESTHTQSTRYPIADVEVSSVGEYGNNTGFRLWAPTVKSQNPVNQAFIEDNRAYPFRISCIKRKDKNSTATTIVTNYAEQYLDVCLKPGVIDKSTDLEMYIGDRFIQSYQNLKDPYGAPPVWGPFGKLHVYDANVSLLLEMFYEREKTYSTIDGDFTGEDDEFYRFNFISGCHSSGSKYVTYQLANGDTDAVQLGELTNIFASGGSDGTMSDELFGKLVSREVVAYGDSNSVLMDDAYYPESVIYDSGFPLETKFDLIKIIAIRKDTAVILSTHVVGGKELTAAEESSLAIALRTRLRMYPESYYYGTEVVRGVIVGRSGILTNSQYKKRLPVTIELADKASAYMGAANGKWKNGKSFDHGDNALLRLFSDVNVTFTPSSVRNKDWANGMMWVENHDRRSVYFPCVRTIYNDDTSILSSFFNMMICVELQKVGARARRKYSGSDKLTEAQLINGVQNEITDLVAGRFDGRAVIVPEVTITARDSNNGFSWTTIIRMYGNNMKTVQNLTIETHRLSDLEVSN